LKLYMAGNFPVMNDIEAERKMKNFVLIKGYPKYLRLVSFYHEKGARNVLRIRRESSGEISKTNNDD